MLPLSGNPDYFLPGGSVDYKVSVTDKEDGSTADGKIASSDVS
jgi:cytochrome c